MSTDSLARFENLIMPHLDAAYNLARWMTRHEQDAQDVVQEAVMRAYKYFDGYHGGNAKSWLLAIVRNTCYTWLRQNRAQIPTVSLDDALEVADDSLIVEERCFQNLTKETLKKALEEMPLEFREILVLRELEGLSYKEISETTDLAIGTVMSRLSRARQKLQGLLKKTSDNNEVPRGL